MPSYATEINNGVKKSHDYTDPHNANEQEKSLMSNGLFFKAPITALVKMNILKQNVGKELKT